MTQPQNPKHGTCPKCGSPWRRNGTCQPSGAIRYRCKNNHSRTASVAPITPTNPKGGGRKPKGDRPMTNAEKCKAYRRKKAMPRQIKYAVIRDSRRTWGGTLTLKCFVGWIIAASPQDAASQLSKKFSAVAFGKLRVKEKARVDAAGEFQE